MVDAKIKDLADKFPLYKRNIESFISARADASKNRDLLTAASVKQKNAQAAYLDAEPGIQKERAYADLTRAAAIVGSLKERVNYDDGRLELGKTALETALNTKGNFTHGTATGGKEPITLEGFDSLNQQSDDDEDQPANIDQSLAGVAQGLGQQQQGQPQAVPNHIIKSAEAYYKGLPKPEKGQPDTRDQEVLQRFPEMQSRLQQ